MLKIEKLEAQNIYVLEFVGAIDEASMKDFQSWLEDKIANQEHVKLLVEIDRIPSFENFQAFTQTIKMKFKAVQVSGKMAVLTDTDWIETLLPVGNFLTSNLTMKQFDKDERTGAIDWLENDTIEADDYFSEMNIEQIRGTNIFTFTINEEVDLAGLKELHKILTERAEKVRFLGIFKDFEGFDDFKTFIEAIKVDFAAFSKLEKYAIVSDKSWIETMAKMVDFITPGLPIKAFKAGEQDAALTWLKE